MAAKTTDPATPTNCRCGCGEPVNPNRYFRQGHDQVLISKLAEDVVEGTGTGLGILKKSRAKDDIKVRIDDVATAVSDRLSSALADKFTRAAERRWALLESRTQRAAARAASEKGRKGEAKPKRVRKAAAKPTAAARGAAERITDAADVPEARESVPLGEVPRDPFQGVDEDSGDHPRASTAAVATPKVAKRRLGPVQTAKVGLGAKVKIKVRGRTYDADVAAMNQSGKVTVATYKTANGTERRVENPVVVEPANS